MAGAERLLVDTSAFYALFSTTDEFHERANTALQGLADTNQEFWTTSYTLVETVALLHRRLGFQTVSEFSRWSKTHLSVSWVDRNAHDQAWDRFMAEEGRGLSFVDWTTVIASREMRAPVFTFDGDFGRQGVSVVPR